MSTTPELVTKIVFLVIDVIILILAIRSIDNKDLSEYKNSMDVIIDYLLAKIRYSLILYIPLATLFLIGSTLIMSFLK